VLAFLGSACGSDEGGNSPHAVLALSDDRALTAPGFSVIVPVLANDRYVSDDARVVILNEPCCGSARSRDGRTIEYSPGEGTTGKVSFSYGLADWPLEARVEIEVAERQWTLVEGEPFSVLQSPAPDTVNEPAAQRWVFSDVFDGTIVGYAGPEGAERAFVLAPGETDPGWLGDAPSRAHHASRAGIVSGALGPTSESRGALWDGAAVSELEVPSADWTELWAVDSEGNAVGAAGTNEGTLPIRLTGPENVEWLDVPDGFVEGLALGVNDAGTVVGAALRDSTEFAYSSGKGDASLLPLADASWSRASDIDQNGTIVGSLRRAGEFARGFELEPAADVRDIHLRGAIATELHGIGEAGELVGTYLDASGYRRGFVATPDARSLVPGTEIVEAADEPNPAVAHACIHSTEGPFRVLRGTADGGASPRFDQPHTSYTLQLVPEVPTRFVYRAPAAGNIALFVHPPAALRLYAPDGSVLTPNLVRTSSLCPKIAFIHQFELATAGDYSLVVDPHPRSTIYVILERSWAY